MVKQVIDGIVLSIFISFVLTSLVVFPLLWFGPEFEGKYFPVVTYAELIPTTAPFRYDQDQFNWYSITLRGNRSCQLLDATEWYLNLTDGSRKRVAVSFNDKERVYAKSTDASLNLVSVDTKFQSYKSQDIIFSHSCHPLWETHTTINIPYGSGVYSK